MLLVLPGNTASSACHPAELDYFGQRYRAVSLDFLGTGQSDRIAVIQTEGAAAPTIQAADVVALDSLDALELLTNPLRLVATLRS